MSVVIGVGWKQKNMFMSFLQKETITLEDRCVQNETKCSRASYTTH